MKQFRSRRNFLFESCGGLSGLALAHLLEQDGLLAAPVHDAACESNAVGFNPFAPKKPHFAPRATSVISLFMSGGVSHLDTFDPKPALDKYAGQPLTGKGQVVVRQGYPGPLMPSPFQFKKYGQSGIDVSEVFPIIAGQHIDDLAIIRSVYGKSNDHVQAHYELATGMIRMGFPSVGSWVTYGLGTENRSLPAYVVFYDPRGGPFGGPANWSAGFMPAAYQGTVFRSKGDPIIDHKHPSEMSSEQQRARLDLLGTLNEMDLKKYPGSSELAARISSYELAYRMQGCAPVAVDLKLVSEATRKLYGLDDKVTEPFARQCLMARRLVERGVRFVQLYHGGLGSQRYDTWDAHDDVKDNHTHRGRRSGPSHRGAADGLEGARTAGFHAGNLAGRVRAHADLSEGRRARPQSRRDEHLDGGREDQGRAGDRIERRDRLQGGAAANLRPRSASDHSTLAGHGPHQAHVLFQWPEHAADGCLRGIDSADRSLAATVSVRSLLAPGIDEPV